MRQYSLNENVFNSINNIEKAYWLGFLYADGYNYEKGSRVVLSLQVVDEDVILKFRKFLNTKKPIYIIKGKGNKSDQSRIEIVSKTLSKDLASLGCIQNKTNTLVFPHLKKHMIPHFIRGYFDGDGSVWEGKRKMMNIKDLTILSGRRDKMIHNVKFNFTGTISIIEGIQNELIKELGFKKTKINKSKKIENCVQLEYSGKKQLKKFYDYLYKDAVIYMNRKKKKFENILCANI